MKFLFFAVKLQIIKVIKASYMIRQWKFLTLKVYHYPAFIAKLQIKFFYLYFFREMIKCCPILIYLFQY